MRSDGVGGVKQAAIIRSNGGGALAGAVTLLVLDTACEEGAAGLYERPGFTLTGEVPDLALKPHGGLAGTHIYWKRVGVAATLR